MSPQQQRDFEQLLARGASPAAACQQIGVSSASLTRTLSQVEEFQLRVEQIDVALSQNVAAALYRAAMQGNVSAQTFWLKNKPPPNWSPERNAPSGSLTFDELFDGLSDDELTQLAKAMGLDLPDQIARSTRSSRQELPDR